MFGFSAGMSYSEVEAKSSSKTEDRQVSYPIHVPAGEGRKVTEVTTTWVSNSTYEAQIATRGPLGIETENYYQIFFMNIEDVFPNKYVSATIIRRVVGTTVDVTISKIPPPTDSQDGKPAEPEILSFHSFTSSNLTGLNPKEHVEARAAFLAKDPDFAVVQEGLTVNFFGYGNQGVPADVYW